MSPRGQELFAAILASPDDDAPRLVYADWLLEQGEPRGELIQLSCLAAHERLTRRQEGRYRALLHANVARWLGPVRFVAQQRRVFERGWLASCAYGTERPALRDAIGSPEWSFLRAFHCWVPTHDLDVAALLRSPELGRIEEVTGLTTTTFAATFETPVLPRLRSVDVRGADSGVRRRLDQPAAFPALVELGMNLGEEHAPLRTAWVFSTRAGKRLRVLRLRHGAPAFAEWMAELDRTAPAPLERVTLGDGRIELRRGVDGRWSDLTLRPDDALDGPETRHVRFALGALPRDALTRLAIRYPAHPPARSSLAALVARIVGAQARIASEVVEE